MEFYLFNPAEAEQDGQEGEEHDGGVGDVRQEHGQLRHVPLAMVNQHEEENEADKRRDQDQEAEEQTLDMKWLYVNQTKWYNNRNKYAQKEGITFWQDQFRYFSWLTLLAPTQSTLV